LERSGAIFSSSSFVLISDRQTRAVAGPVTTIGLHRASPALFFFPPTVLFFPPMLPDRPLTRWLGAFFVTWQDEAESSVLSRAKTGGFCSAADLSVPSLPSFCPRSLPLFRSPSPRWEVWNFSLVVPLPLLKDARGGGCFVTISAACPPKQLSGPDVWTAEDFNV